MTNVSKIWKSHRITLNTKIAIVINIGLLIFQFAYECRSLKQRDRKKIEAFEMYCWPRMLRVSWTEKRTNWSILQPIQIHKRQRTKVAKNIAKFFGHVVGKIDWKDWQWKIPNQIYRPNHATHQHDSTTINKNGWRLRQMESNCTRDFTKSLCHAQFITLYQSMRFIFLNWK